MTENTIDNHQYFKKQLSKYLYFIRGIAIILVVVGHVIGYNITYGMRQIYNSNLSFLGWICDLINTFHMPTFFIASGIAFAAFSNKNLSYQKFFTSKFQKLFVPLIVWCPLYFIFQSLAKSRTFSVVDIINSVIYPYEIFWFLHVLIFSTLLSFIYFKNLRSVESYLILSVALFIISILANSKSIEGYLFWNIFYAFGVFINRYLWKIETIFSKNYHLVNQALAPCLCLSILIVCEYILPKNASVDYLRLINGTVGFMFLYLLSIQLISYIDRSSSEKDKLWHKITEYLQYCGAASMAIYLFHGYFTGITKVILLRMANLPNPILYFLMVSLAGILFPLLIYNTLRNRSKLFLYSIGAAK